MTVPLSLLHSELGKNMIPPLETERFSFHVSCALLSLPMFPPVFYHFFFLFTAEHIRDPRDPQNNIDYLQQKVRFMFHRTILALRMFLEELLSQVRG